MFEDKNPQTRQMFIQRRIKIILSNHHRPNWLWSQCFLDPYLIITGEAYSRNIVVWWLNLVNLEQSQRNLN